MPLLPATGPDQRFPNPPWNPGRTIPGMALTQYRPGAVGLSGGDLPPDTGDNRILQEDGFLILQEDGSAILWESP